jgi:hypothetical protein
MWQGVLWVVRLYIPPAPGDDVHMFRYHLVQSVGIVGMWAVFWLAVIWLVGRLPPFVPQIAWASDVATVSHKVDAIGAQDRAISAQLNDIRILSLRTNISQQFKDSCLARRSGNQGDLDRANDALANYVDQYYQLSGRPFALPRCETVLVESKP